MVCSFVVEYFQANGGIKFITEIKLFQLISNVLIIYTMFTKGANKQSCNTLWY